MEQALEAAVMALDRSQVFAPRSDRPSASCKAQICRKPDIDPRHFGAVLTNR